MKLKTKTLILSLICLFTSNVFFAQVEDSAEKSILEEMEAKGVLKEGIYDLKGKEFPAFELSLLNGEKLNSESLRGKPTLINFWFTNCAPCIDEMPMLNEIQAELAGEVNFVAITFEDKSEVNSFLEKSEFNFRHLIDAREYIKSLGFFGYPKTILLDKNFTVVEIEKRIPKSTGAEKIRNEKEFKTSIENKLSLLLKQ